MLKKLRRPGSRCGSGTSVRVDSAIVKAAILSAIMIVQPAAAATVQAGLAASERAKWMKICKADIQRFCDEANLKQECLIAHWSKISAECQDVLGASAGNRAGDGS